jgi:hypothetical protein
MNSGFKLKATVTPDEEFDSTQEMTLRELNKLAGRCFLAGAASGVSDLGWKNYVETDIKVYFT